MPADPLIPLDLRTLHHRLEDVPADIKNHVRMGFDVLMRADSGSRADLYARMMTAIRNGEVLERAEGARILNTNDKIVGDALAAISLTASMLFDLDVDAEQFTEAAQGELFENNALSVARELANTIERSRDDLRSGSDESDIANSVLPSFRKLDYEIDLRLRFSDDLKVTTKVPVAVLFLRTDVTDDVWFQATEAHLVSLSEKIDAALKKMRAVRSGIM